MQREKLFFSTIYLVISLFASLASIPLLFVVIPDPRLAAQIGIGVFIAYPCRQLDLTLANTICFGLFTCVV